MHRGTREYGTYLMQLISMEDDEGGKIVGLPDYSVDAVLWTEEIYKSNQSQLSSLSRVLFIGNSALMNQESSHMDTWFNKFGMMFRALGNKAVMRVTGSALSKSEHEEFSRFCQQYGKSYTQLDLKGASVMTFAPLGAIAALMGPVGWTGLAVSTAIGGLFGSLVGSKVNNISDEQDRYTFLSFYAYMELLPRFMGTVKR